MVTTYLQKATSKLKSFKRYIEEKINDKLFFTGYEKEKLILDGKYKLIAKAGYIPYSPTKPTFKSDQFRIEAHINGASIAWVNFEIKEGSLEALDLHVDQKHRRKGIATEMYNFAKELGNDIRPSSKQTGMGKLFWIKDHSVNEAESQEIPALHVTDKELVTILGKLKTKSLLTNEFFRDYSIYERAYRYGKDRWGFSYVEAYFYFSSVHKTTDGKIRPEVMVKFDFSFSGSKIINAHKYHRAKEPNDLEKKFGPSAGWNHLKSWKEET